MIELADAWLWMFGSSFSIQMTVKVEIAPESYFSYVINKRWKTNILVLMEG